MPMRNSTLSKPLGLLLLAFGAFTAQSQDILWEKSYGGKHAEFLFDAIPTPDYGFILAGSSISNKNGNKSDNNQGNFDYWVWKMDDKGGLDWQKSFGGKGLDLLQSIRLTADAGFILAGTSTSGKGEFKTADSKGNSDFWIIKLDAKGAEMWQQTIGGAGQEKLQSIARTADGGYIIGGSSSSSKSAADTKGVEDKNGKSEDSRGNLDYWIVKLDKNGTVAWQKTMGGLYVDELKTIEQTRDGGYIIGGYSNSPVSGEKTDKNIGIGDYWIVKTDDKGNIEWQKTLGGDLDDQLHALSQTADGGYIVGGSSNSGATNAKSKGNTDGTDFWVLKLDRDGVISWQETYNFGKTDILTSIVENADGSYLIGGYAQGEQAGKNEQGKKKSDRDGINDYIALKINSKGEKIWNQSAGSKGDEVLIRLLETRDGGYVMAGTSKGAASGDKSESKGGSDFWVVKLKDKSKSDNVKQHLEVLPNPAESFTNVIVGYDYLYGTASLYDMNGRQLQQVMMSGEKTVPFDLSKLPSGIYIINVETNVEKNGIKVIKR
jgi:hypothetical protein